MQCQHAGSALRGNPCHGCSRLCRVSEGCCADARSGPGSDRTGSLMLAIRPCRRRTRKHEKLSLPLITRSAVPRDVQGPWFSALGRTIILPCVADSTSLSSGAPCLDRGWLVRARPQPTPPPAFSSLHSCLLASSRSSAAANLSTSTFRHQTPTISMKP